ncbi:MAG: hypothetical protein H2060_03150 [Azoarcus sp.]|nr:hypothetical protein [Azoarcus sp.]
MKAMQEIREWLCRLRAWCRENERAHRDAPASPCCSAPPPGALRTDRVRNTK